MKRKHTFRLNRKEFGCILIYAATFGICLWFAFSHYGMGNEEEIYNRARILLQDDLIAIKEGDDSVLRDCYMVGIDGRISFSNVSDYTVGEQVNLTRELQFDYAFAEKYQGDLKVVFPVEKAGRVASFAVFWVKESEVSGQRGMEAILCFLPLFIWFTATLVTFLFFLFRYHKRMLVPMEQMAESAQAIIGGDYSRQIVQEREEDRPQNQIQNLIYSFESMRDELKSRVERENNLRKEQKELMSCMSHDLRTPITTIQAHAEALRDGIIKEDSKKKDYYETIVRKTEVLNHMIADLLDHSNAQLNQLKVEKQEIYFSEFMDRLAEELGAFCQKANCQFVYEREEKDILVQIDQGRISQVIYNLVENACKYMDKEKAARVSLCCARNQEERRIYIRVKDNGPGIEMVDIPYVFDRFYRAEKSRSMQIPGAGLGLSICRYIVEAHQGEISINSRKGEGCEVSFFLNY